ncbi:MAG: alpha/beta hydrolase, partial [Acidimicrobiia bacterium]
GNSLGALLSEIVASTQPSLVRRLVLISPATPPRLPDPRIHWPTALRLLGQATPILGKRAARFLMGHYEPEELVKLMMDSTIYQPSRVAPDIVEQFVRLAETRRSFPWAIDAVPLTGRSIAQFFVPPRRFVSMIRSIKTPTLVVQGIEDRIVSPTAVEWLCSLRPDWTLIQLADTGHTPQLDAPIRLLETIKPWLESNMMSEITA